jgi:quercetin dioxygenase-like cupin family protein
MKYIKILESNIDVKDIQDELLLNASNWKHNLELVKQSKIHCTPNRSKFEKDIILVAGPYKIDVPAEKHSYSQWVENGNMYDDPSVEFRKTPFFDNHPLLVNYLYTKFPSLKTELVRIIISKLHPGDKVAKHYDVGRSYRKNRFHFSIQGTYKYYVGDEEITIHPGTLFWFDNKQLHWAENTGDVDRITTIFDIDPIYCKDLNLPINNHRYLSPIKKNGSRYFCNDIDGESKLFLYEQSLTCNVV